MEIDLDEDGDSDGGRGLSKRRSKTSMLQEKDLRQQLKVLLAQPLMLRGLSAKYLTAGGSSSLADQMLSGSNHRSMLGFAQSKATEDHR
jgi:ATP-dependent RNA helicase DDX24/MAK5